MGNLDPPQMPEPQLAIPDIDSLNPNAPETSRSQHPHPNDAEDKDRSFKFWHKHSNESPPAYTPPAPPPSGFRIPLSTSTPFPASTRAGQAPCTDLDTRYPVFLGSAILNNSVHPCKIAPHLPIPCRVPYGGSEFEHTGRYDLLPFDRATMEFVRTSHGKVPHGRRPVEGGYEENGQKLYHAVGVVNGVRVPGKTGEHLGGCNVAFGGRECFTDDYEILCWKH